MLKSFVLPDKFWLLIRNIVPIYCFKVASLIEAFLNYSQNLSRFFTVQLSMFVVVIFNSLYILSCFQVVVNNFFIFLCCRSFAATLISYHVCHCLSTTFFILFRKYRAEKEGFEPSRRSPDLYPQQGHLFGHLSISPNKLKSIFMRYYLTRDICYYTYSQLTCQGIFFNLKNPLIKYQLFSSFTV